ncbi:MAG: ribonuclease HII [Legionellales bacterium]|nr:ribonuclease HII [Legionellales bacterium]OUX64172.1 MAG: ribonuclease HII [Gammaproteobacteria bacterium TMED281]
MIVGVDEVGRGPLAGPVVAAAVIVSSEDDFEYRDSKLCSNIQRNKAFAHIMQHSVQWSVSIVEASVIDRINILQASLLAMKQSVDKLSANISHVYVDGNQLPKWQYPSTACIKGDQNVRSIAAASIVAKVIRDQMMIGYDRIYPGYQFASHKGYPTADHMRRLKSLKPSKIHRVSFGPIKRILADSLKLDI